MKKLLYFLVGLLVLAGVAVVILFLNINPILEKAKPTIEEKIAGHIGQPVELGELSVQFFPSIGVKVDGAKLGKGDDIVSINKALLAASLGDLIGGNIAVSKFEIDGAEIAIKKSQTGISVGGADFSGGKNSETEEPKKKSNSDTKVSFKIDEANLDNINLKFVDASVNPPQTILLKDIEATVSDIDLDQKGKFSIAMGLFGSSEKNFNFSGELKGKAANSFVPNSSFTLDISSLDLDKITSLLKAYQISLPVSIGNKFSLKIVQAAENGIAATNFDVNLSQAALAFQEQFKKAAGETLKLKGGLNIDFNNLSALVLEKLNIDIGDNKLAISVVGPTTSPKSVKIKSSSFSVANLANFVPQLSSFGAKGNLDIDLDVKPSGPLQANGKLALKDLSLSVPVQGKPSIPVENINGVAQFGGNSLKADDLNLVFAGQPLNIGLNVEDLSAPKVKVNLNTDRLEVGKLMAATGSESEKMAQSFIEGLKVSGDYQTKSKAGGFSIKASGSELAQVPFNSMDLNIGLSQEYLSIKPSALTPFGGNLNVQGRIGQGQNSLLSIATKGDSFDVEKIYTAFVNSDKIVLSGTAESIATKISGDKTNLLPTATGGLDLNIIEGALQGINLFGETLTGIGVIPGLGKAIGKYVPEEHQPIMQGSDTPFDSLDVNVSLNSGRARIENMALKHTLYIFDGTGDINLLDGSYRMGLRMRLTPVVTEQMILSEPKLKLLVDRNGNMVVPILVKKSAGGRTLVVPDTEDLAKRAAKNTAKEAAGKALDKVAPGLGGGAGELIDGLLN